MTTERRHRLAVAVLAAIVLNMTVAVVLNFGVLLEQGGIRLALLGPLVVAGVIACWIGVVAIVWRFWKPGR